MGIIEMYVNPQNLSWQDRKQISEQRTKGGFVLQYWGPELGRLNISGTTGSSGVEGINVLQDIYNAEQLAFDPYALAFAAEAETQSELDFLEGAGLGLATSAANLLGASQAVGTGLDIMNNAIASGASTPTRQKPTLASIAFSVEMYWSGWVFRGYFLDFKLDERAERLGLFDYSMTFVYTQKRGFRTNFLAWHRSPTDGPSNSDPEFGTPYSYNGEYGYPSGSVSPQAGPTIDQSQTSGRTTSG
jgi:hypothetical protein